jgi:hypothetical protein
VGTRPLLDGPLHAEPVDENAELREQLADLRERFDSLEESYQQDRDKIGSLLHSLRAVFGGGGEVASPSPSGSNQPIPKAVYDAWKERLPPSCGRVIDALLVQPMGYNQLKSYCKASSSTIDAALSKLRANGLIEKDGNLNRLKRL